MMNRIFCAVLLMVAICNAQIIISSDTTLSGTYNLHVYIQDNAQVVINNAVFKAGFSVLNKAKVVVQNCTLYNESTTERGERNIYCYDDSSLSFAGTTTLDSVYARKYDYYGINISAYGKSIINIDGGNIYKSSSEDNIAWTGIYGYGNSIVNVIKNNTEHISIYAYSTTNLYDNINCTSKIVNVYSGTYNDVCGDTINVYGGTIESINLSNCSSDESSLNWYGGTINEIESSYDGSHQPIINIYCSDSYKTLCDKDTQESYVYGTFLDNSNFYARINRDAYACINFHSKLPDDTNGTPSVSENRIRLDSIKLTRGSKANSDTLTCSGKIILTSNPDFSVSDIVFKWGDYSYIMEGFDIKSKNGVHKYLSPRTATEKVSAIFNTVNKTFSVTIRGTSFPEDIGSETISLTIGDVVLKP